MSDLIPFEMPVSLNGDEDTKRVTYAKAFKSAFLDKFNAAESNKDSSFEIEKKDFDKFIIRYEFANGFYSIPETGTKEWIAFLIERNSIRGELNSASAIGQHGHPPFRIDNNKDRNYLYTVQLLTGMVKVTYTDAAEAVKSLASNKMKSLDAMTTFFQENSSSLPPELRVALRHQSKVWDMVSKQLASQINGYLDLVEENFRDAQVALDSNKLLQLDYDN